MSNKIPKGQHSLPLLKSQERKQGTLHTGPPRGWAGHLRHASGPLTNPSPSSPHLRKQLAPDELLNKGNCHLFLLPCEGLPELLWSLINFYWLKSLRTQVINCMKMRLVLYNCFTRKNLVKGEMLRSFISWKKIGITIFIILLYGISVILSGLLSFTRKQQSYWVLSVLSLLRVRENFLRR